MSRERLQAGGAAPRHVVHETVGRISVIIVNWNGRALLADCLDSLRAQTRAPLEVLVVDNGSSDGSQEMLRTRYPEVVLFEQGKNTGFSRANNVGLRVARGEYVALLNNDVVLEAGWMAAMAGALDADGPGGMHEGAGDGERGTGRLGSVACKMLFYDRRDILDSAGVEVRVNGTGRNRGLFERDSEVYQLPALVFGACAGAAMYRMTMFREVGLFDEDLYIYYEDVDLSFRAQLAGYDCAYVPAAVVYHHHAASSGRFSRRDYYLSRNSLLVIVKDMPSPLLARHLPAIAAVSLTNAVALGLSGQASLFVEACRDTLKMLPLMLRKRRVIQARTRRPVAETAALLQ